jgi:hypothetical protein
MLAEMKTNQEILIKMEAKTDGNPKEMKEEIKGSKEEIIAEMKAWREELKTCQEPGRSEIKAGVEEVKATDLEVILEEVEVVAKCQKVPNEEAAVEAIGAPKDRSGDQRPALGCKNPLKRRTKDDIVHGNPKGRTFEKRPRAQPKCNSVRPDLRLGSKETF